MKLFKIIAFTDGGSRGNPGKAAIGVVVTSKEGKKEYSEYLGEAITNNEAEYQAVIFALKKIKQLFGKKALKDSEVEICSDSELLVSQVNGKYKIMNENIARLFLQLWNLKVEFSDISFKSVPREKNKEADFLVNEALDKKDLTKPLF
jgi:ribonuclease HI